MRGDPILDCSKADRFTAVPRLPFVGPVLAEHGSVKGQAFGAIEVRTDPMLGCS